MLTPEYLDSLRAKLASVAGMAPAMQSMFVGPTATEALPKLLDEIARLQTALDEALVPVRREGMVACRAGKGKDCNPYMRGTENRRAWHDGWIVGEETK